MKGIPRIIVSVLATCFFCVPLFAQPNHGNEITEPLPAPLSAAEAKTHLDDFRRALAIGDFCLKFELVHYPRRGEVTRYEGLAWASWSGQDAPVTRFRLREETTADSTGKTTPANPIWEWLVQNGATPHIWVLAPGATAAREVPPAEWRQPIFSGTVYTPYDLLMPFLYWPDFTYGGASRVLMRAVDVYTMKPPVAEQAAALGPVRISIYREYNAFVRTEQFDAKGALVRQFDLGGFATVHDRYIMKDCELHDLVTHDTDHLEVAGAALGVKLDAEIFDPAHLNKVAPLPDAKTWVGL